MNASATKPEPETVEFWVDLVHRQAAAMRFGSLQLTIEDGAVTQIEATERKRLPHPRPPTAGRESVRAAE